MDNSRYSRNEALFGAEGQARISGSTAAIVGYGGLGSVVGPELAYLGVTRFRIVEFDDIDDSSLNRFFGATPTDVGIPKSAVARRTIEAIEPDADIRIEGSSFSSAAAQELCNDATVVFGCFDADPPRVELLDWASERGLPYIDAATDVGHLEDGELFYGGRVVVNRGDGCLICLQHIDQKQLAAAAMSPEQQAAVDNIYGVDRAVLDGTGPSVISINAVVASLAVTEFMVMVTGLREPLRAVTYRADVGGAVIDRTEPNERCAYCVRYRRSLRLVTP